MKKIFLFFLSLTVSASLFAQTAEEALGYAQEFREGTARTMAMGNAFTALGGDLGAIGINPASSGVFRYFQIAVSPSLTMSRSMASYLGNDSKVNNTGFTLSNMGAVLSFDTGRYTGLLNFNFAVVYNKKNSFRSKMSAYGTTDGSSMLSSIASELEGIKDGELERNVFGSDIPWPGQLAWNTYVIAPLSVLGGKYANVHDSYIASTENYIEATDELRIGGPLDQTFNRRTWGSDEEFSFNFGGNVSDFFYFGVNADFHTVTRTVEENYEEAAQNPGLFQDGFVSMSNNFWLHTGGSGIGIKLGAIVTPVAGLRLGATVSTPTWYRLTDEWDYTMSTAFNNNNKYTSYSPTGAYSYRVTTPMRWSLGAAYTFFDRGLISVDFENTNYANTRILEEGKKEGIFAEENQYIRQNYLNSSVIKLGGEFWIGQFMALRGGYQYHSPAVKGDKGHNVFSAGLGFRIGHYATIDLAWTHIASRIDSFQLYNDYSPAVSVPVGTNKHSMGKVVCTFAYRF